ncbi:hypothetical protein STENM327S_04506 [Streptomyces tendae]
MGLLDPKAESRAPETEAVFYQRCTWCGTAMYHRVLCPVCRGSELRTERSEGTGTVRHATVVHRNTPAARNVSLIEMAEGFVLRGRVMGPLIGIHSGGPGAAVHGQGPGARRARLPAGRRAVPGLDLRAGQFPAVGPGVSVMRIPRVPSSPLRSRLPKRVSRPTTPYLRASSRR